MIDTHELSLQFHKIHQDLYADLAVLRMGAETDAERDALRHLAAAVSLASSLASSVTRLRMDLQCGCGDMAFTRDMLGAPICPACSALVDQAAKDLKVSR